MENERANVKLRRLNMRAKHIQNGVISKNCSVMAYEVIKKAASQIRV